jgi:hypothetical protein
MKTQTLWILLFVVLTAGTCVRGQTKGFVLENNYLRYEVGPSGENIHFTDKANNVDYCDHRQKSYFAHVVRDNKIHNSSRIIKNGRVLSIEFEGTKCISEIALDVQNEYISLEVRQVRGDSIESITLLDLPLTLSSKEQDTFVACVVPLNLQTRVLQSPVREDHLAASGYSRFGITGVKAAIVVAPEKNVRAILKKVFRSAHELPQNTMGGPFASDFPFNHGSYLFNRASMTKNSVSEWVKNVKSVGFDQVDFYGVFRYGDFFVDTVKWEGGEGSIKSMVNTLHQNGISSILHSYAFFIDKRSKYVTPKPNAQLAAFATYTLSEPITASQAAIGVNESTINFSLITGGQIRNSVSLQIEDEIVVFSGVAHQPPFSFTNCTRGAYGTKASSHDKGAKAKHLKECFGCFVPDPDSDLFDEIAANQARAANQCNFDGIYLDAIDASDILNGKEDAWYYGAKFVFSILRTIARPVGMEMSDMTPHFWWYRSRWVAWDYPARGYKKFLDLHIQSLKDGKLLPFHLGWWNFQVWDPPQVEPTFQDDIDYLGCKMLGYDAGVSLTTIIDDQKVQSIPAYARNANLLKQYEELRRQNYFNEKVKEKLREEDKEYTISRDLTGPWRVFPVKYSKHVVQSSAPWSQTWEIQNSFQDQPVLFRIEALLSVADYNDQGAVTVINTTDASNFSPSSSSSSIKTSIAVRTEANPVWAKPAIEISTLNNTDQTKGSWVKIGKTFSPEIDLRQNQALGFWICGDGQNELLNVRLESPPAISFGAIADHYINVDFTGWRYYELLESESEKHSDYSWPEGEAPYHIYRELISYDKVQNISLWYNNLPKDTPVRCMVSPVKALKAVSAVIANPRLTINGKTIRFPAKMESGSYIEYLSDHKCKLYGAKGELIAIVAPEGDIPLLLNGKNTVTFQQDAEAKTNVRTKITLLSIGNPLK